MTRDFILGRACGSRYSRDSCPGLWEGIRFHDLRHTHASELLSAGTPVKTVSKRLGHANATVTMNVYAHLMSGDDERVAKLVQKTLGKRLAKKGVKDPK
jgi:integrase